MFHLNILFILLTFCHLLLSLNIQAPRHVTDDIITVEYCDLIRNPGPYHKRVVRVHAKYRVGAKWSNLYDPNCGRPNETWVNFDESYFDESFRPCEKLNVAEGIKFRGFDQVFDVVLVGKFYGSKETNYGRDGSRFMLVAGCVERADLVETSGGDVPTVSYCDLARNPSLYDKRVIRVQGVYSSGFESSTLSAPGCDEVRRGLTWVEFDELYRTCTSKDVEAALTDSTRAREPESFTERRNASVVFLGYFEVSPTYRLVNDYPRDGFGHMGAYKNQLTVKCLEQAKPLPVN